MTMRRLFQPPREGFNLSPMSAPDIRPTTEADLPAITAIYQQAVREGTATFELDPPDLNEMTRRYRCLLYTSPSPRDS